LLPSDNTITYKSNWPPRVPKRCPNFVAQSDLLLKMQPWSKKRSNSGSSAQHAQDNLQDAADEAAQKFVEAAHAENLLLIKRCFALANAEQEDFEAQLQADAQAAAARGRSRRTGRSCCQEKFVARVNAKHIDIEERSRYQKAY
jgi:hypothetical protein